MAKIINKVNILGTNYTIEKKNYETEKCFKEDQLAGYCNFTLKEIVIGSLNTFPNFKDESAQSCRIEEKETLRHEITHAFLNESGLNFSALNYSGSWARNEEMVDWIALQGPKIYKAWQEAGAI